MAPAQNTRVRPSGLTFFPSSRPAYEGSPLALAPVDGVAWFAHDPSPHRDSVKLLADGDEGFVAHRDQVLLLVKVFPDVAPARQASGEGEG